MNSHRITTKLALLLTLSACIAIHPVQGFITADGRGVFRVAVTVNNATTLAPISDVILTMKNAGGDELKEDEGLKHLLTMFAQQHTGIHGDAFVYYYGGFSSESDKEGMRKYRQQVRGMLIISKEGFETVTIDLEKAIGTVFNSNTSIPLLDVRLEPKSK